MTLEAQRTSATIDATTLAAIEDRVASGDRRAFAELCDLLAPRVHAALAIAAGPHRAEELALALLVDAWERAPRIRRRGASIAAWVLAQTDRLTDATRPTAD